MFHLFVVQMVSSVFCEFETSQGYQTLKISVHSEVQKSRVKIKKKNQDSRPLSVLWLLLLNFLISFYAVSFTLVSFLEASLASAEALPWLASWRFSSLKILHPSVSVMPECICIPQADGSIWMSPWYTLLITLSLQWLTKQLIGLVFRQSGLWIAAGLLQVPSPRHHHHDCESSHSVGCASDSPSHPFPSEYSWELWSWQWALVTNALQTAILESHLLLCILFTCQVIDQRPHICICSMKAPKQQLTTKLICALETDFRLKLAHSIVFNLGNSELLKFI